jgi:hypothetical protein
MNDFPKNKRAYVTEYALSIFIFCICAKFHTKEKGYNIFGSTKAMSTMYLLYIQFLHNKAVQEWFVMEISGAGQHND